MRTGLVKNGNSSTWTFESSNGTVWTYQTDAIPTNADLARTRTEIQASIREVAVKVDSLHSAYLVVWWVLAIGILAAGVIGGLRLLYKEGVRDGLATCKERKKAK